MRDDPWTAANRDREQQKVTIPPKRRQTAETAPPPSKPTVSGPFWTGKKSAPDNGQQRLQTAGASKTSGSTNNGVARRMMREV
jgi:hypothetical protein